MLSNYQCFTLCVNSPILSFCLEFCSLLLNLIHLHYILRNSVRQRFLYLPMRIIVVPEFFIEMAFSFKLWIVIPCLSYAMFLHMCVYSYLCILFYSSISLFMKQQHSFINIILGYQYSVGKYRDTFMHCMGNVKVSYQPH